MVKRKPKDAASPDIAGSARPTHTCHTSQLISALNDPPDPAEKEILETAPKRPAKRSRKSRPRNAPPSNDLKPGCGSRGTRSTKPATIEQHLMDQNIEAKKIMHQFKEDSAKGRSATHEILRNCMASLETTRAGQQKKMDYNGLKEASVSGNMEDNPLFRETEKIIRLSRAILERHKAAESELIYTELAVPIGAWREDERKMRDLLQHGQQYGQKLAETLLGPEEREPPDVEHPNDSEELAPDLFEQTKKAIGVGTWGQVAQAQVEALAGVINTFSGPSKIESV